MTLAPGPADDGLSLPRPERTGRRAAPAPRVLGPSEGGQRRVGRGGGLALEGIGGVAHGDAVPGGCAGHEIRPLLDDVDQLVGKPPPPRSADRVEGALAEDDLVPHRVGPGPHRGRRGGCPLVDVDPDVGEVALQPTLHLGPQVRVEGRAPVVAHHLADAGEVRLDDGRPGGDGAQGVMGWLGGRRRLGQGFWRLVPPAAVPANALYHRPNIGGVLSPGCHGPVTADRVSHRAASGKSSPRRRGSISTTDPPPRWWWWENC